MDQRGGDPEKLSFRFLPATRCRAERLASVYDEGEREGRFHRLQSLLNSGSAERCFFVTAGYKRRTIGLLQLCREKKRTGRFRIRGLYCCRLFRNRGLATRLLQLGVKGVFEVYRGEEIASFILPTNKPSITAHERAGFRRSISQGLQPERHLCLTIRIDR